MSDAEPTVSDRLAAWACNTSWKEIPSPTRAKARDILVDVVGLCIAARGTDYVAATLAAAEPGPFTLIGHETTAAASSAALVNGTAAHGEDFDDTFEGGPVHSGVVVVPALLAAAQMHRLDNDRTMLGMVVATETLCRLALALPKAVHRAGFHPTAVLGTFAATLGVCVATGASERVTRDALGIAGSMASGIIEYLGDGSWTKRMHAGWAAQSGLRAHALAAAGFNGPARVFEGEHGAFRTFAPSIEARVDRLFEGLGERFMSDTITFKPYPCGTMVQPFIDVAIALRDAGAPASGIRAITCKTAEGIVHRLWEPLALKRDPPTPYAAKFSVPFGIALGLARGRATLSDFEAQAIGDPALRAISDKVSYEIDPGDPYPDAFAGHVRIEYEDGSVREANRPHMRGGREEPLSREEIDDKFRANVAHGGRDDAARLLDACERIASGEGDASTTEELA